MNRVHMFQITSAVVIFGSIGFFTGKTGIPVADVPQLPYEGVFTEDADA